MLKNILLVLMIVAIDQFSKLFVIHKLALYETLQLLDIKIFGLNLFLTYNTGVAFGLFHDANGWQNGLFLLIAIAAACSILYLIINNKITDNLEKLALLLILGGAIGNLIDRVIYGHVIDFIDVYAAIKEQYFHWYTFNIADSAICIGVGLLLCSNLLQKSCRAV
jgi:signal peptidase II